MHIDFSLPYQDPVLVFALILLIILFVPIIMERIKIPSILGFIIAGIFIGGNGFNIISRDSSIELFGTVGILYLMFIAGLEIDINEFLKNKTKGIVFGIITVLIPMFISIPIFYYVLNYSLSASILIGGIFASHTLVTYPLVSKLGITKNLAVNISIAGTLIADVSALLILAVVTKNVNSSFEILYWVKFVAFILIFAVIIFWVMPKISRWFLKKYSDNVLQYIFVLSVVFISAFLSMLVGLEPIVGAFFAGLSLNRLIPHSSPLMNRIDFIGNAIFIPFFLIGVGMLINYEVMFQSYYSLLISLIMVVIAVSSKYLAAISTRQIFNLSKTQGLLIFGLSNARVAAALAIALIGFDLIIGQTTDGDSIFLLDENILNGVIIMIVITSTISSFVTQSAGKKIAKVDLKNRIPNDSLPSENTLIGIANQAMAENLINLTISTLDKKVNNKLFGLTIVTEKNETAQNINRAEKLITHAKKIASSADINLKTLIRYDINITSGIINTIKERQINHFFIGLHVKSSILDSFLGRMTADLLKKSDSTIYINKLYQPINTIKKFLVVIPPNAHLEKGFCNWLKRIIQISLNTGNKLTLYASEKTNEFIINKTKTDVDYNFKLFTNYNEILIISQDVEANTMIIFCMARKNSISYENKMDLIGNYIVRYFNKINFMLIYPNSYAELSYEQDTYNVSLKDNVTGIKNTILKILKK